MPKDLKGDFVAASEKVKQLKARPSNDELLKLYSWYKQATTGDVTGKRPGMFDIPGRKKYDAWEECKGMAADQAMTQYTTLVNQLVSKYGA